jgi:hypothetical protein
MAWQIELIEEGTLRYVGKFYGAGEEIIIV